MTYHAGNTLIGQQAFSGVSTPACVANKTCVLIGANIYWTNQQNVGPNLQPSNCYNAGTSKYENQAMCANSGVANPFKTGAVSNFLTGFMSVFAPQPQPGIGAPMPINSGSGMPSWVIPVALGGVGLLALLLLMKKKPAG
ncbi:MAG: hypothetical protein Q8S00_32635 [Deltaproteobacteria bacterium]|nr:hypothetical protein [Deltaproteobacteria bacterium]